MYVRAMAPILTKLNVLFILFVGTRLPVSIRGDPKVPCAFFLGDSLSDNGNNNVLRTLARVNYKPYGIDYKDGATGRYNNGKNLPDFIAELLGFQEPIPPFATAKKDDFLRGVNYASGGSGILNESGENQGEKISLSSQLVNHGKTVAEVERSLGNAAKAKEHLRMCFYSVDMGSNDYLNNYFLPQSSSKSKYSPNQFADLLSRQYHEQLRALYDLGARKIAIFGVGLLGCIPQLLSAEGCVQSFNQASQQFNYRLPKLVDTLNRELPDAKFIFINITSVVQMDPSTTEIKVVSTPCCPVNKDGLCVPGSAPCTKRNEYAFWDNFHPTEALTRATAMRAYSAGLPTDSYPTDILHLVEGQAKAS